MSASTLFRSTLDLYQSEGLFQTSFYVVVSPECLVRIKRRLGFDPNLTGPIHATEGDFDIMRILECHHFNPLHESTPDLIRIIRQHMRAHEMKRSQNHQCYQICIIDTAPSAVEFVTTLTYEMEA